MMCVTILLALALIATWLFVASKFYRRSPSQQKKQNFVFDEFWKKQDATFRTLYTMINENDYELFFRRLMNNVPFPVYCKDADDDFRYLFHNSSCADVVGAMFIGRTDAEIFPKEIAEKARQDDIKAALLTVGSVFTGNENFMAADGTIRIAKSFKQIIVTSSGRRLLLGFSIDITQDVALRNKLAETNSILQTILDNIPAGIAAKNVQDDLRYILWNKELERHTGITAEQVIGRNDREIEPWPGLGEQIRAYDMQAICDGELRCEKLALTASGRKIVYSTFKKSVKIPNERHLVFDLCLDVTRQRELEENNVSLIDFQKEIISQTQLMTECMRFAAREVNYDTVCNYILQRLVFAMNADRGFTCKFTDDTHRTSDCIHEMVAGKAHSLLSERKNAFLVPFDKFRQAMENFETYSVNNDETLENGSVRDYMIQRGLHSTIFAPIQIGERLRGYIGLEFLTSARCFSENDLLIMQDAASLFGLIATRNYYKLRTEENAVDP